GGNAAAQIDRAVADLLQAGFSDVEYVELRAAATLDPVISAEKPARLLAAASIGGVRLIDNIPV
ncbi:MAG: pantoate--beta-alanine ligase, partial [Gemmobacter sp.]